MLKVKKGNTIIEMNEDSMDGSSDIVAKLPKEQLKSLFYLFAGKPDSRIKVYSKPLFIDIDDIYELNDCITTKLKLHHIDAQITSLTMGFEGSNIQDFSSWTDFQNFTWQTPERTEEIVIKWDFLVSVEGFSSPQRHTLLVRLSNDMKPGKFMQMIASGNSEDFDQIDVLTAPAFCRVDFINLQLSKELINEVTLWVEGRKEPALITDIYYFFKKNRQFIALLTHHSTTFLYILLWVSSFLWANEHLYNNSLDNKNMALWLFIGIYGISIAGKLGFILASKGYTKLEKINGKKVVFEFTSGDKKSNAESIDKNKQHGKEFIKQSLISLTLSIIGGVIVTLFFLET